MRRVVLLLTLLPAVAACSALDPTGAEPAFIIIPGDTAGIMAPDSVPRGVNFQIEVETFGGGCIQHPAHIDSKVVGTLVELRPFNEAIKAGTRTEPCPPVSILIIRHTATAQIKQPGRATIRVLALQRDFAGRSVPAQ